MGIALALALAFAGIACDSKPAPPSPSPAAPAPAAAVLPPARDGGAPGSAPADAGPPRPKMVANPDGLSLVERIAKRKAAEQRLAGELAAAEETRLLKYDKSKLPLHTQVFTFIKKTRAQYDALEKKVGGAKDKAQAAAAVEKMRVSLEKSIVATGKKLQVIDPKGGNSNVTTDYDVMLNALHTDYPAALTAALGGDLAPLAGQKAELDKRTTKIETWLAAVRKAKK
jgi:hypothetical protein